jgi:Acetyltransferase (GNAT) domain
MKWSFAPARKCFEEARSRWDELNASRGNHILLDSLFADCALRHFADDEVQLGIKDDSRQPALAIVKKERRGTWQTFQPSQAPIGFIVFPARCEVPGELAALIRSLPGYALQLSVLQQDPDYSMVPRSLDGPQFESLDYIETGRVTLAGTFDDYWKARSINLRHKTARLRRRMAERAYLPELIALRNSADVVGALKIYAELESKGWKSGLGTAVTAENAQGLFYRELLEQFCARREAVIYQFRVSERVIATDLCLQREDMLVVLKTTYDESWKEYSPAILMREEIVKQIFREGQVRRIEFYGRVMDWHKQWTDNIRTMYHVNCFRSPWVRSLKSLAKRVQPRNQRLDERSAPQKSDDASARPTDSPNS